MSRLTRKLVRRSRPALALALLLSLPAAVFGQDDLAIVRVEEDWELVVGEPDPNLVAPQLTCALSPTQTLDGLYLLFDVNHQNHPDFVAGGVQLQVWSGDFAVLERKFPNTLAMAQPGETGSWTQAMAVSGGNLSVEITNGRSATWGLFGAEGYLKAAVATEIANLNGYSPDFSTANSGVGYASNRVVSLVLKRVRYYTDSGAHWEDATPRTVFLAVQAN
ncbi:MAG: hypothetical protein PHO07_11310 [Pirellulales bacterium]|nr:hypothetical protein [Pirellulales bacterium]